MDNKLYGVKLEDGIRFVCCVCDRSKAYSGADYCCSKNCEKLFILMQGLVVGNMLQSLYRDVCEDRGHRNDSNLYPRLWSDNALPVIGTLSPLGDNTPDSFYSDVLENEATGSRKTDVFATHRTRTTDSDYEAVPYEVEDSESALNKPDSTAKSAACMKRSTVVHTNKNKHGIDGIDNTRVSKVEKKERQSARLANRNRNSSSMSCINVSLDVSAEDKTKFNNIKSGREGGQEDMTRCVSCIRCGKMITKCSMYTHYRAVHRDHLSDVTRSSLACSDCGKEFMRKESLNTHKVKRHNYKFTNTCKHCGKGFANGLGLSWHLRQVHKVNIRQCGTCGETFDNRREYKRHHLYKHTVNSHVCHICGKGFKLKNALQAHLDAHAGIKLHFCEICGGGFVRFSSLCQHKNNVHGPNKSELPFKCHLCPSTFRMQAWLDKHIARKHKSAREGTNAECELCQSSLQTARSCPQHTEPAKEVFACQQCNKEFAKITVLKAHMKQHQEPKFSCEVCHKKFTYKCNMLRHMDTHSSKRSYYCDLCGKESCSKYLLASHRRTHDQEQQFKCDICGKGLTRKDYLKNHLRKMHPEHLQSKQT